VETATDLTPFISVILPALHGFRTVDAALSSWENQTRRDQIEIILLSPDSPAKGHAGHSVLATNGLALHEARAAAIRAARGDYIILAEDHCLPDPDCVEAVLDRLGEGWEAVGPALRPGVHGSIAHGSFLVTYSQWLHPLSGPIAHLPGHNSFVRKAPLVAMGSDLEEELLTAMFLMARLHDEGARFFIEARARMRHFDVPSWKRSIRIFFVVGEGCGAMRTRRSSRARRAFHIALTPFIAARHFGRGVAQYYRTGGKAGLGAGSIFCGAVFACAWAVGEAVGSLKGIERVKPDIWLGEIKPLDSSG
jgi:glycosyltransferase involved in cell wall biosynthesis